MSRATPFCQARAPCSALQGAFVSVDCPHVIAAAAGSLEAAAVVAAAPCRAPAATGCFTPRVAPLGMRTWIESSPPWLIPCPAGREVVGQLLCSPRWSSVTAVGRRAAEAPAEYKNKQGYDASKLHNVVVRRRARMGRLSW